MTTVTMLEAKTRLSQPVSAIENGIEEEIIIARDGKPAARLLPIAKPCSTPRSRYGHSITEQIVLPHRAPFDRLLIIEPLTPVTRDSKVAAYSPGFITW